MLVRVILLTQFKIRLSGELEGIMEDKQMKKNKIYCYSTLNITLLVEQLKMSLLCYHLQRNGQTSQKQQIRGQHAILY